ncbi:MAG: DUF2332 domain-containing protein [Rhodospirillaceae bacterium]|nr:DUF2332 domain-containing protein [Rhodospirillaceae bacterium]
MSLTPAEIERAGRMFAEQLKYNVAANAPTYAAILEGCISDLRTGGPVCGILEHWDGLDTSAFALRILSALHRLALDGKASALAALFPTTGGIPAPERVWPVAKAMLADHADYVIGYCARPPQTNEVARSAILLGGFLAIADQFLYPLRLLEIGASAGLNLMWDKYRTTTTGFSWGESVLELRTQWEGPLPNLSAKIAIASRAACDRDPIDIRNADDRARLESYVWAEQVRRMERLRQACAIALQTPFRLERADAADWLAQELRDLPKGQTTVVYHSIFRQYVSRATDAHLKAVMAEASARATNKAPLAWLALEVPDAKAFPDLTLTMWPGGASTTLATAHYHGEWVRWR